MTASAQQTHAGGRNKNKLAQGYKNPACIGRDGIEKATATGRGDRRSRGSEHWTRLRCLILSLPCSFPSGSSRPLSLYTG